MADYAWRSDAINELAAALARAQGQMQGAKKDADNPFFKSKYADLAAIVEAIRIPFSENGLAFTQLPCPTENESVEIETVLMHASGQWLSGRVVVPVAKADAQGYGSALTYARRYGLQAIAGVAAEDDDDGNAAAKAKPAPRASRAEQHRQAAEAIADETPPPDMEPRREYNADTETMRSVLLDKINHFRNKKQISDDVFMGICAKFRVAVGDLGKADPAALNDILNATARWQPEPSSKRL